MNQRQIELWTKLRDFEITPLGSKLTFAGRLARENRWDLSKAILIDREYRRFLFLLVEAGHPVTPSDEVDQAWHLHLLYTRSYWDDMCRDLIQMPLHHGPTTGGKQESAKYADWYAATLDSYERFFGVSAPEVAWPSLAKRFENVEHFCRVNKKENLIIPAPQTLLRMLKNALFG